MKLFLNANDNETTLNKKNYLLRAAERLGLTNVVDIKSRVGDESTDYILNIEPFDFIKGNIWTGIWEIDLLCDRPQTSESDWAVADTVFIAVSDIPQRLEGLKHKTKLLFQACDPELHRRTQEPDVDFIIAGTMDTPAHAERMRLTDILKSEFTYKAFDIHKSQPEYVNNLSQGRIQFIRSMGSNIAPGELAQRFFECLAIGPVMTNWVPDLVHTGLVEGQDYFSYRDDSEMLGKIRKLLKDPAKATEMAKNGRLKALAYHTYEHRLVTILEEIRTWSAS